MKTFFRWSLRIVGLVLVIALAWGAWFFLWDGRPPAQRPDLVRVPVSVVAPGHGYPTLNALYLAFALKWIDTAEIQKDHPAPEGVTVDKLLQL